MTSLYVLFLKLLPKNLLSRFIGFIASKKISKIAVRWFAKRYKVNLDEASKPVSAYGTLNEFFTRHLKDGCRPIHEVDNPQVVVAPVDGKIAQWGKVDNGQMIQAKGRYYTVQELIGNEEEAEPYLNGLFMTIYLAPTDYHRIHHHTDGSIEGFRYVPGTLFPVNPFSVNNIEKLFPVNERITTFYNCAGRKSAIVKVGATIVGKIKVTYCDVESNISKNVRAETFHEKPLVSKGDELGLFAMGSTVVLLFPAENFAFVDPLPADRRFKVGQTLGYWQ